jgi:hypothetical protein
MVAQGAVRREAHHDAKAFAVAEGQRDIVKSRGTQALTVVIALLLAVSGKAVEVKGREPQIGVGRWIEAVDGPIVKSADADLPHAKAAAARRAEEVSQCIMGVGRDGNLRMGCQGGQKKQDKKQRNPIVHGMK